MTDWNARVVKSADEFRHASWIGLFGGFSKYVAGYAAALYDAGLIEAPELNAYVRAGVSAEAEVLFGDDEDGQDDE